MAGMEIRASRAHRAASTGCRGNAARRRPSVDWPLSREEKKCCALQLYERDVQSANDLLRRKDRALVHAHAEIKELRRQSGASQSEHLRARDSPNKEESSTMQSHPSPRPIASSKEFASQESSPNTNSSCTSHGPLVGTIGDTRERQARMTSPSKQIHRSGSTGDLPSVWWAPVWQAVRKSAHRATETATGMSRILADEARILADEVRLVASEVRSQRLSQSSTTRAPINNALDSTKCIEWRVEFPYDAGDVGVSFEMPSSQHDAPRVSRISEGQALDTWNSSKLPVTVYLQPGNRESVMRHLAVRAGDELVAIDGEPIVADTTQMEIRTSRQALSFRRKMFPRKSNANVENRDAHNAAPGGA